MDRIPLRGEEKREISGRHQKQHRDEPGNVRTGSGKVEVTRQSDLITVAGEMFAWFGAMSHCTGRTNSTVPRRPFGQVKCGARCKRPPRSHHVALETRATGVRFREGPRSE